MTSIMAEFLVRFCLTVANYNLDVFLIAELLKRTDALNPDHERLTTAISSLEEVMT